MKLHEISFANIKDITEEFLSPRPNLFAILVEKKPQSLYQLAKLAKRDYANVYKDIKNLESIGIVKLEREGGRIKPIPFIQGNSFWFSSKSGFSFKSIRLQDY